MINASSSPSPSSSSAVAKTTFNTNAIVKRPIVVLPEDDYVASLSAIIQRDYFPDLKAMKLKTEYLDAVKCGDVGRARMLGIELRREISQQNQTGQMSIDQFQAEYTSEDNHSFKEILSRVNAERRILHKWAFEDERKALLMPPPPRTMALETKASELREIEIGMMVEGIDSRPIEPGTWEHKAKNALMYVPEGLASSKPMGANLRGEAKSINRAGTRIGVSGVAAMASRIAPQSEEAGRRMQTMELWRDMAQHTPGLFRDPSPTTDSAGGKSYDFVPAMPSPSPNVMNPDHLDLMTWGVVEGTPRMLSPTNSTNSGATPSNSRAFAFPSRDRKEALVHRMLAKTEHRKVTSKLQRASSPALRFLAGRDLGDNQLRKSYGSSPYLRLGSRQRSHLETASTSVTRLSTLRSDVGPVRTPILSSFTTSATSSSGHPKTASLKNPAKSNSQPQ